MPTHIGISDERAGQLRTLAENLNISTSEAIGYLLEMAMEHGLIPHEVPGFNIWSDRFSVHFEVVDPSDQRSGLIVALATMGTPFDGALTAADARALAERIERISTDPLYKPAIAPMEAYRVGRVGTGIAISMPMANKKRVVPKDVARSVAALLRKAADESDA